jgi:ABC-type transport system substrate-binding protein
MAARPGTTRAGARRYAGAGSLAIGAVVLMATLAGGPGLAQTASPADPDQTLRIALYEGGRSTLDGDYATDPAISTAGRLFRCCLARTLMAYPGLPTLDGGTVLHPDLAADAPTISADGLLWTFRIRPGVRYQPPYEDRTVVAADVIRAIERSARVSPEMTEEGLPLYRLEGAAAYARSESPVITGLQSSDPMSLTFRLTAPDGAFGHHLTDPSTAPIPEGVSEGYDPVVPSPGTFVLEAPPETPVYPFGPRFVSTGPYMFETHPADTSGGRAALVRNPSWDPATDPIRRPVPQRIEISTAPSLEEAEAMRERSEVDIVDRIADADTVARFQRDPELAGRLLRAATDTFMFVPMNLAVPPFDDVAVRRAVNAAVDRAALLTAFLDGRAAAQGGFRLPGEVATHVFADDLTAGLLVAYEPFPSAGDRGDPAAARAEMRNSRYDTDGDGLCDALVCSNVVVTAYFPAMGELLREGLASVGIQAEVREITDEVNMSIPGNRIAMQANEYQVGYGLRGDLDPALRGGSAISDEWTFNQSLVGATPDQLAAWGYQVTEVPGVDDLLDACQQEMGNRRARCWAHLDQVVSEAIVPWIPVYSLTASWVLSPRIGSAVLDQSALFNYPALERTVITSGSASP